MSRFVIKAAVLVLAALAATVTSTSPASASPGTHEVIVERNGSILVADSLNQRLVRLRPEALGDDGLAATSLRSGAGQALPGGSDLS